MPTRKTLLKSGGGSTGPMNSRPLRYATASALVIAALGSTLFLQRFFPYPFLFLFFAAVMASGWFGGRASGLFAVFLSTLAVDYFFTHPFHSFAINAADGAYFAAFFVCAVVASWVSSLQRRSEDALRVARDTLEARVTERTAELEQSNAEMLRTQAELARLSRALSMGELTSSIAHEVDQPLTAVVASGYACLEWLALDPPRLDEARQTAERIVQDGTRAGAVLSRVRALFNKEGPARDWFDLNEVIQELIGFLRDEAKRQDVTLRTELSTDLPQVLGDRVQLQQVVLNLVRNGMEALRDPTGRPKELTISTARANAAEILLRVDDSGIGLAPEVAEQIFNPFFTTKPQGIGMGLSISRSILESHNGRIWAEPRPGGGARFQCTIPIQP